MTKENTRVQGIFRRNNSTPNYNILTWECAICKEEHRIKKQSAKYLQLESDKKCPRCGTVYDLDSFTLFDN